MTLQSGDRLCGFRVNRVRECRELQGRMVEMIHEKTLAPLCWLDNQVKNKVFCITFPTFPEDDTGVFHILEHSTLCGSKKYPVREPFVELMKGSMQTFLNAMTFPDKTMYPVASRNDKDYLNLAGVYLDAVFAPRVLEDPNIFYQEGWHLELEEGRPVFRGVVLNEMKGSMGQPDDVVVKGLFHEIFRDNTYAFHSGGDPESITDLTYEQFVNSYRRFYHPSNSMIYLDGAVPLEETLSLIDSYLKEFEPIARHDPIRRQEVYASQRDLFYELGRDENPEGRDYFAAGHIICSFQDHLKIRALQMMLVTIGVSNDAPLIRCVLDKGIAKDVEIDVNDSIFQPYISIMARNVAPGRAGEILPTVQEAVRKLVRDGIDRKELEATLNLVEFKQRERSEPQGVSRAVRMMDSWLYGGDPLDYLTPDEDYARLREMLDTRAYEELLQEVFLDQDKWNVVLAHPDPDLGEKTRRREQEKLRAMTESMTEEQLDAVKKMNAALHAWQKTPDTPEQLATIPHLQLSDLGEMDPLPETEMETVDGVPVLKHHISTNGITYVTFHFQLSDLEYQDISLLELMINQYTSLPTEHYDTLTLQREVRSLLGKVDMRLMAFDSPGQPDRVRPYFCVSFSALDRNLEKAEEMVLELVLRTRFDQKEKLLELLHQDVDDVDQGAVSHGQALGVRAVLSAYTARGALLEAREGTAYIRFLHGLLDNFEERWTEFERMNRWLTERIGRKRLVMSVASSELPDVKRMAAMLPEGTVCAADTHYECHLPDKTAIRIPAQISFAVRGWSLGVAGKAYSGRMEVMDQIVSLAYLWNTVRVQGGAYGTGQKVTDLGDCMQYSFRDPTPDRSLEKFTHVGEFLREFARSGEPLDGYIISVVNSFDPMLPASAKANDADMRYFLGRTEKDMKRIRDEMLSLTMADLPEYADLMDRFGREGRVCIVGHDGVLKNLEGFEIVDIR